MNAQYIIICFSTDGDGSLLFEEAFWAEDQPTAQRIAEQWSADTHLAGMGWTATVLRLVEDGNTEAI